MEGIGVRVTAHTLDGLLRASVDVCRELFPNAPSLASASSSKVSTPCFPETHESALAAAAHNDLGSEDKSGG